MLSGGESPRPTSCHDPASDTRVALLVRAEELTPDALAKLVGMEPDSVHDRVAEGKGTLTVVRYTSHCDGDAEAQLTHLLARLQPVRERIFALSQTADVHSVLVSVAQFVDTDNPTFLFSPDHLSAVAELGAALWFDVYLVDEPQ